MEVKNRSEVEQQYTWSLERVYPNQEDIETSINYVKKETEKLQTMCGKIGESNTNLLVTLNLYFSISQKLETLYVYHSHRLDEDHGNSDNQARLISIKNLYSEISSKMSFVIPEILQIDPEVLKNYMLEDHFLGEYRKFIDDLLLEKAHVLNQSEERLMSLAAPLTSAPYEIYSALTNADMKFPNVEDKFGKEHPFSEGLWSRYSTSTDRKLRENGFKTLLNTYGEYNNTIASLYINYLKTRGFLTKSRNFENPRQRALFNNQIDEKIYDNLLVVTNHRLGLNHRYLKLRKELLGVDELHMYDMYVPIISGVDRDYTYVEAKKLVYDASAILGSEYQEMIKTAFNQKWIDVYENKGKRGGAYSGGSYETRPYILLNYTNKINDVFTLAHELGHSMHTYYTNANQSYQDSHYKIFVAEIASIVNELLLMNHMLNNEKLQDKERAYILNYNLDQFRATVYRQTMFAEYEYETSKAFFNNDDLSSDILNEKYYQLVSKYFGEDVYIDQEIENEWMRIPHFYMDFYVYQYATSYCVASKIAKEIINGNEDMKVRYLNFLKAGDSISPIDLIQSLGIDVTKKETLREAFRIFEKTLNQFEGLIKGAKDGK